MGSLLALNPVGWGVSVMRDGCIWEGLIVSFSGVGAMQEQGALGFMRRGGVGGYVGTSGNEHCGYACCVGWMNDSQDFSTIRSS